MWPGSLNNSILQLSRALLLLVATSIGPLCEGNFIKLNCLAARQREQWPENGIFVIEGCQAMSSNRFYNGCNIFHNRVCPCISIYSPVLLASPDDCSIEIQKHCVF